MKKFVLSALMAVAVVAAHPTRVLAQTACPATPTPVTASGSITGATTWTRNNIYLLSGFVYVRSGGVLTIEPGTIIKGDKASKGSLIVEPGGQILANGTAAQPIVFTSNEPAGSRARGDWGGVIILGRAPVNLAGTPTIEGGVGSTYGGNLPNDNSGVFRYVRIEFSGIPFQPNSEINGLTMGGVGAGTTISHVQVHSCGDDSFEWFGGSVNAKYLISNSATDDDFDTDNGFTGRMQYGLAIRGANVADVSGSTAFESDNDNGGSANTPQTAPVFSNFTALLQNRTATANFTRALHLRRNTATSIFNSVLAGWPQGLFIDGAAAQANATAGTLVLRNNVLAGMTAPYGVDPTSGFNHQAFFEEANRGNQVFAAASALGLNADNYNDFNSNGTPNGVPDLALPAASALTAGASFADAKLTGAGNGGPNSTFDVVSYRGAFGPASTAGANWAAGWTNFNPQITCYNRPGQTLSNRDVFNNPLQSLTVSPNPTDGAAPTLAFDVQRTATATVRVVDMMGRTVATVLTAGKLAAGPQRLSLPATLAAGVYMATVNTGEAVQSVRFVVTK